MGSPGFHRVMLIPMETTLYGSENAHTEKQLFGKGLTLEIKLGPLFRGLVCPKYSQFEVKDPQVMILHHFYTIPQMNGPHIFVFQKKIEDIHFNYDKQLDA